jgi:hypothetical protein
MITWPIFKNHLLDVGLTQTGTPWHSKISEVNIAHLTTPFPRGYSHAHAIYQDVNVHLDLDVIIYAS